MKAKVSLKTVIVSALLLVCGLNASADNMKYNYKYDDQNRMTESEALKWNSTKNTWGKDMCIRYAYQGKTMTTTYYKWNNKKGEYILVPEMTVIMDNPNM